MTQKEKLLDILDQVEEGEETRDTLMSEITKAYMTLKPEERKYVIRRFAMESESNFEFLYEYAKELYREAFLVQ